MIDECLYKEISRVYGSFADRIVDAIYKPMSRLYLRVNTMYISRGELVDSIRARGLDIYPDKWVPDAVYFPVKGPNKIDENVSRIIVDRFAAESIMLGANVYAPGVIHMDDFGKGDKLVVYSPTGIPVANAEAVVSSREARRMRRGIIALNINPMYAAPAIRDLPEYEQGLVYPQSLPSIITGHVIEPFPEGLFIDMNAAPGGKTSHVVQLSRGGMRVVAFERNTRKIGQVHETLKRLRLFINTVLLPLDSRYIDTVLRLRGRADRVLIDPPCTGLGVRPKILVDKNCRDLINSYRYQRHFFTPAYRILAKGGRLVYSTCTITLLENEENIHYLVEEYGFEPVDLGWLPYAEKTYYKGVVAYRFGPLTSDLNGYFIAVLEKKS